MKTTMKKLKKAKLILITAIIACLAFTGCKDTNASTDTSTDTSITTKKAETTEQVKNAVTGETEAEETTTINTEKTQLDRNTNINISVANFEDYTADEIYNIQHVLPTNNSWRFNMQCAYSTNLTTGDDTVTEITDYQSIIDAFHENNSLMKVTDITSTIEANKFHYEASYSYEGLENTPNGLRVMPDNININHDSKESVVYGFVLKSKDFNIKNFMNINSRHDTYDKDTKTLYMLLEDDGYAQCDDKLKYQLCKNNTEICPIITIDTREYLDAENIVFIKPEIRKENLRTSENIFKLIKQIEFLKKHVDEKLIVHTSTCEYTLENISDDLETLTLTFTGCDANETYELKAWQLIRNQIYCHTYPEINY